MVHKLRRKFIRIAMVSVTLVMLLMAVSINTINFLSTDSDLEHTRVMIRENAGNMPQFSPVEKPGPKREERFSPEKPYSTRYFVLYYTPSGTLTQADMKHIAAVTEEDAGTYLEIARKHGEGFGYTGNYKFYVVDTGKAAGFLRELQGLKKVVNGSAYMMDESVCGHLFRMLPPPAFRPHGKA